MNLHSAGDGSFDAIEINVRRFAGFTVAETGQLAAGKTGLTGIPMKLFLSTDSAIVKVADYDIGGEWR